MQWFALFRTSLCCPIGSVTNFARPLTIANIDLFHRETDTFREWSLITGSEGLQTGTVGKFYPYAKVGSGKKLSHAEGGGTTSFNHIERGYAKISIYGAFLLGCIVVFKGDKKSSFKTMQYKMYIVMNN